MIEEAEYGGFYVHCDQCFLVDEREEETWSEMIAAIRADGWSIRKDDDGWSHTCPNCIQATH